MNCRFSQHFLRQSVQKRPRGLLASFCLKALKKNISIANFSIQVHKYKLFHSSCCSLAHVFANFPILQCLQCQQKFSLVCTRPHTNLIFSRILDSQCPGLSRQQQVNSVDFIFCYHIKMCLNEAKDAFFKV